jgi:hypothetical protein
MGVATCSGNGAKPTRKKYATKGSKTANEALHQCIPRLVMIELLVDGAARLKARAMQRSGSS